MKLCTVSLSAVLFFAGVSLAQANDFKNKCEGLSQKAARLVSQYKVLRDRRLTATAPGIFDKDLQGHGGKLHRVLSALGVELGHPPHTKKNVVNCLGKPDAVRNNARMRKFLEIYNRELRKTGRKTEDKSDREYLIYFWRGWHDFLFFISRRGMIVDHGWWFAYE